MLQKDLMISTTKTNKQLLIFFFLHVDLAVSIEKNKLTIERFWTSIFWNFWTKICNVCEINKTVTFLIVDLIFALHTNLNAWNRKNELMIENFWMKIFWCSDSNVWKDDNFNEITKHWIDLFFFYFDTFSDVKTEKCVFSCEMIALKINVDLNICFDVAIKICNSDESNDFSTIDFFFVAHIKLIALIEKQEFVTNFKISW